jgi:predicted nucleic acid-binding protein
VNSPALRSGDALHLAIAQREQLTLATANRGLIQATHQLGVAYQQISGQPT